LTRDGVRYVENGKIQDHRGEWWIPTGYGLFRFPKVESIEQLASVKPKAFDDNLAGLNSPQIFRIYEDSRGDLWLSTTPVVKLLKWERATETFHDYTPGRVAAGRGHLIVL
jgi:hypothetical protein